MFKIYPSFRVIDEVSCGIPLHEGFFRQKKYRIDGFKISLEAKQNLENEIERQEEEKLAHSENSPTSQISWRFDTKKRSKGKNVTKKRDQKGVFSDNCFFYCVQTLLCCDMICVESCPELLAY